MNNRILAALSQMRCPVPETLPCRLQLKMAQPGQIVCLQDYPVTEMMLLVRGELLIEAQFATGDSLIFSAENGISVMGDMELLSGRMIYASTVRAKTKAELLVLSIADFQLWLDEEPAFREMVIRALAEKCYCPGISERTVNRALSELRERGVIHTEYGKVFFDDKALRQMIAE